MLHCFLGYSINNMSAKTYPDYFFQAHFQRKMCCILPKSLSQYVATKRSDSCGFSSDFIAINRKSGILISSKLPLLIHNNSYEDLTSKGHSIFSLHLSFTQSYTIKYCRDSWARSFNYTVHALHS